MGLGSLLVYPLLKRKMSARTIFSLAHAGTALAALATFGVLYRAAPINNEFIIERARDGTLSMSDIYWTEAALTATLMLLPTLCMGLVYPSVCDSFSGAASHRDRWVGQAYFIGTLGSVLGTLLIALVLIPRLGLHGAFALLVGISAVLCVVAWAAGGTMRDWRGWGLATAGLGLCVWAAVLAHDPAPVLRLTIAVQRAGRWQELDVAGGPSGRPVSDLVHVKAGATATVMVKRTPGGGDHFVFVDDQLVASTNLEAKVDALMLAHLPLLLHPQPQSALTVGFGTGGTSHAITTHGIDAYCVEIEPEVPRAARLTQDQNFGVLDHPRFTLILNDARDHLHAGTRTYDAIATDVTNLQYKQNGNLYTVEYFELMRSKLNPGGIACAWIPLAGITPQELRVLMRSFGEVFPHATLWFMNHTNTNFGILIGTPGPLRVDFARLQAGFADPAVSGSLKSIGIVHPLQLVHCLHLDEEGYRRFCGDVPLHTDDLPVLEFSSPLSYYQTYDTFRENLAQTLKLRPTDFRPYVVNVPDGMDAGFERHQIASHNFCRVVLLMYAWIIDSTRGRRGEAADDVGEARALAEAGMAAWPEDQVRAAFYADFFHAAGGTVRANP
jgi:spermidine synthase